MSLKYGKRVYYIIYLLYLNHIFYADDTQLYYSFKPSNALYAANIINDDLSRFWRDCLRLPLKINATNSLVILFAAETQSVFLKETMQLCVGEDHSAFGDSTKSLGLILDSELRFRDHITAVTRRAFSAFKLIYFSRRILDINIKSMLSESLVLSHFNFCDVVYGLCLDGVMSRWIQRLQNACVHFIFGIIINDDNMKSTMNTVSCYL